jgi:Ca2+-binding EF-hand superfamily protein
MKITSFPIRSLQKLMYFHHKKFSIEKERMAILNKRFMQYDEAKLGRITPKDARLILRELGLETQEAQQIVIKADLKAKGMIEYDHLVETLRLYMVGFF